MSKNIIVCDARILHRTKRRYGLFMRKKKNACQSPRGHAFPGGRQTASESCLPCAESSTSLSLLRRHREATWCNRRIHSVCRHRKLSSGARWYFTKRRPETILRVGEGHGATRAAAGGTTRWKSSLPAVATEADLRPIHCRGYMRHPVAGARLPGIKTLCFQS